MSNARRLVPLGIIASLIAGAVAVWMLSSGDEPTSRALTGGRSHDPPGLVARSSGDCAGVYEVASTDLCTHGDDLEVIDFDPSALRRIERPSEILSQLPGAAPVVRSSEVPCYGNGSDGSRVQAIYGLPSDLPDQYEQVVPHIRFWAWAMDTQVDRSAAQTGGDASSQVGYGSSMQVVGGEGDPSAHERLLLRQRSQGAQGTGIRESRSSVLDLAAVV